MLFQLSYAALWILVLALGVAVVGLYQHFAALFVNSREGREAQGPAIDALFPEVEGEVLGTHRTVAQLRNLAAGGLVAVVSTECGVCRELRAALPEFIRTHEVPVIVVCAGPRREVEMWVQELGGVAPVLLDNRRRITTTLRVATLPYCIAVDDHGFVRGKGLVNGVAGLQWAASALEPAPGHLTPQEVVAR